MTHQIGLHNHLIPINPHITMESRVTKFADAYMHHKAYTIADLQPN